MCSGADVNPFHAVGSVIGDITGPLLGADKAAHAAQSQAEAQYAAAVMGVNAQKEAFNAQLDFARESRAEQAQSRGEAVRLAQASPQELAQMGTNLSLQNQALTMQMSALQRNQAMLDAADPAIKEAGSQALQLLQGKQAQAVQPILDQRSRQKQQLEQTLADRLGPDYAQSSAGASALRSFDNDTSVMTSQVQQQTLGQLLGVAQNTSMNLNPVNQIGNAFSTLGSLNAYGLQAAQNIQSRQVNAFTGNPVNQQLNNQAPNYNGVIQAAGAGSVGQLYQGQAQGQVIGSILGTAGGIGLGSVLKNVLSPAPA